MDTPGKILKAEREKKEISLDGLARSLKIKTDYIKAIEEESYQSIPGKVFVVGYIRAYANALCIDSNYILSLYKQQVAKTLLAKTPATNNEKIFTYRPILIIVSIFILIIPLIVFTNREEKKPATNSLLSNNQEQLSEISGFHEKFSLKIIATELTWISVGVDSNNPTVRFMKPGDAVEWTALNGFSVKIGNAAGAKVTFNGKDIGNLGPHGKVVKLILPEDKNTQENGR